MAKTTYKKQVNLLLSVLPEVAKEKCFALHGGTAINLFIRDMPRLSVDIDLTYMPIEDRQTTLVNIAKALDRVKLSIEKTLPQVRVAHLKDTAKLQVSVPGADIKIEVNLVGRGIIAPPVQMTLCARAQEEFDAFCVMNVVPLGQLYGGKICAALDRQHPRDLYDIKYLLEAEGFTDEIKAGFIFCLLGSDRPLNEVLVPNFQDQRSAMANQFSGMTEDEFSYQAYEENRNRLVKTVHESLTQQDKDFLLKLKGLAPDWSIYDFSAFPSVQWKLHNLQKLKDNNPDKYEKLFNALERKLFQLY